MAWAASKGWAGVVKFLLEHGADVSIKDNRGKAATQMAALNGHSVVVQMLIQETPTSTQGQTQKSLSPIQKATESAQQLMDAAATGDVERVRQLLENGVNPNAKRKGTTAFGAAAQNGHNHIVELMLDRGTDVNVKDDDSSTALAWAAFAGKNEVVRTLIRSGATIDAKASDGLTPVARAIMREQVEIVEIVEILLHHGADPNGVVTFSATTMSLVGLAISLKHAIIADTLIFFGADVNNKSYPPLMFAVAIRDIPAMELLIARGVDVNIGDDKCPIRNRLNYLP